MPTLLIADDSMFQRFQAAKTAAEAGFEVLEAKNGEECLTQARAHHPDVVLLDLNMPDPAGSTVMDILAKELPGIRIMVLTADIQETTRQRCLALGAVGFLNKPVDQQALGEALRALL